jgi:hypothetical protein
MSECAAAATAPINRWKELEQSDTCAHAPRSPRKASPLQSQTKLVAMLHSPISMCLASWLRECYLFQATYTSVPRPTSFVFDFDFAV